MLHVPDEVQTNAVAYNMYGLLLERQGLHKLAVNAFARLAIGYTLKNQSNLVRKSWFTVK